MLQTAYISIGSNLGRRAENCRRGIDALAAAEGVEVISCSRLFLTEPVDYRDQQWFMNVMVKIRTHLEPLELLTVLKTIEREAGRTSPTVAFGPRVIDLDILFYADLIMKSETLVLPHPRMHKRHFVLQPLCDIDPEIEHPVYKKNVRELRDMLSSEDQKVRVYE